MREKETNKENKMGLKICNLITINLLTRETAKCGAELGELFTPFTKGMFTSGYCFECEAFANVEEK
tara:strand:- start:1283 stop:1480 length:198 start_codon:yes stop_codon:yes gene_type:complete